ncbi:hypothetical protein KSS93_23255 [Pseudomonas xanthosomatis]|uniref:hypothetical protein n=1 Tax=Pseudomonas xanthosomatis TaxID=2842356 RepID=UPI001C3DC6DA|nr:hypothetical protein [Pseudomonas xanthosomatis]QXH45759.1 hypothetical protein KSS93_23255 [Pseudomonas xanthosomatis]
MAEQAAVTLNIGATVEPTVGKALAQIERQLDAFKRDADTTTALTTGAAGFSSIATALKAAYQPVKVSGDYQALIGAIGQRSGASATMEAELAREVVAASRGSGMSRDQVARLVGQMMDKGMSLQQARDNLGTATTFAYGQGVEGDDTAALMRSLQQAGLKQPQALREGLGLLVAQARDGGFDSAELAKWIPKLLPAMDGKQSPLDAVRELGALLQAQRASANGADDAGEMVKRFLEASEKGSVDFSGDSAMRERMRAMQGDKGGDLDADLARRLTQSGTKWQQSQNAWNDLLRSAGDGMRPLSDGVADEATQLLQGLTDLTDACPRVVVGLTAVAGLATLAAGAYRTFQLGKGVFETGKGLFKKAGSQGGEGLSAGARSQPVNVFVTNFGALGGAVGGRNATSKKSRKGQRKARRNGYTQPPQSVASRKGVGDAAMSLTSSRAPASVPKLAGAGGQVARGLLKRVPAGALVDGAMQLAQVYTSEGTPQEKAEGYGSALGGMGGTLAGAAAGAAIGSVVPVVGTLIGGLIGGFVGGMGGEEAGGWLGRVIGGGPAQGEAPVKPALGDAASAVTAPAAAPPVSAATAPLPANQQFTFTANMPVTFNNSLDDPSVIQQLEQIARRTLTDLMERAKSAQLTDPVYV